MPINTPNTASSERTLNTTPARLRRALQVEQQGKAKSCQRQNLMNTKSTPLVYSTVTVVSDETPQLTQRLGNLALSTGKLIAVDMGLYSAKPTSFYTDQPKLCRQHERSLSRKVATTRSVMISATCEPSKNFLE
jgi:hypothetical protein